jgi:hypothetical protein
MSNDKSTVIVPSVPESEEQVLVEKQSLVKRGVGYVKTHKKTTIAVGALVGLIGVAALTGKKTSDSNEHRSEDTVDIEVHEDGSFTVSDTTVPSES